MIIRRQINKNKIRLAVNKALKKYHEKMMDSDIVLRKKKANKVSDKIKQDLKKAGVNVSEGDYSAYFESPTKKRAGSIKLRNKEKNDYSTISHETGHALNTAGVGGFNESSRLGATRDSAILKDNDATQFIKDLIPNGNKYNDSQIMTSAAKSVIEGESRASHTGLRKLKKSGADVFQMRRARRNLKHALGTYHKTASENIINQVEKEYGNDREKADKVAKGLLKNLKETYKAEKKKLDEIEKTKAEKIADNVIKGTKITAVGGGTIGAVTIHRKNKNKTK